MTWTRTADTAPDPGVPVLVATELGGTVALDVAIRIVTPTRELWLTAEWTMPPPTWWQPLPAPPEAP